MKCALIGASLLLCGLSVASCDRSEKTSQDPDPVFYGTLVSVNGRAAATDKVELTLWPSYFRVAAACGLVANYADGRVTEVHEPAPAMGPCADQDLKDLREAEAVILDHPRIEYQAEKTMTLNGRSGGVAVFDRTGYMDYHPE
ncbi:hypothetical protein [Caulobacter rhizosphaerae]|jgi:hypothetical protein|uniref:Heat shock protein HslJ n=1 Tax=Caulobacter rhizosphaerae TaxID=2010972 RepID=A0ABU1MWB1_9CAUL|nr:hypothetical protein [Caulobacter rhizosphaerae]MDR6530469.1 hypothetical protein [Caulobacter rhizosphaerae]